MKTDEEETKYIYKAGKKVTDNVILMNFTGIYKEQQFYQGRSPVWIDLEQLTGCSCYCDTEAADTIRERIKEFSGAKIHFLDSGNYHYMSLLWLEKVKVPFRLILFDNHTDMQPPAFGGLLSCGGWAAEALEKLENLKELVLIGPAESDFEQADPELRKRVRYLSREKLRELPGDEVKEFFAGLPRELPCYLSVDKDILCPEDASTAWSQGDMRLEELVEYLRIIFKNQNILGMDVCGEGDPESHESRLCNDRANARLAECAERIFGEQRKRGHRYYDDNI